MTKHDNELEQEIKDSGANDNRVTPALIDSKIVKADYYTFPDTTVTICLLTLENGFSVTGESACADPANYKKEIGDKIAHDNARDKIWALEAYLLKQKMSEAK